MFPERAALNLPRLADVDAPAPPAELAAVLGEHGVALAPAQLQQLQKYVGLLLASNRLMNLTALQQPEEVWLRLLLDALLLAPALAALPDGARVLDVGCGAGIPGMPLAVACPRLSFTLLDATAKKVDFVAHAARELGLGNVSPLVGRAEALAAAPAHGAREARPAGDAGGPGEGAPGEPRRRPASHRESFDVVTARAVAPLRLLLELTAPFARAPEPGRAGGRLLLTKGQNAEHELQEAHNASQQLGVRHVETISLPTGKVLSFEKHAPTPPQYPRGNGLPKRRPL